MFTVVQHHRAAPVLVSAGNHTPARRSHRSARLRRRLTGLGLLVLVAYAAVLWLTIFIVLSQRQETGPEAGATSGYWIEPAAMSPAEARTATEGPAN